MRYGRILTLASSIFMLGACGRTGTGKEQMSHSSEDHLKSETDISVASSSKEESSSSSVTSESSIPPEISPVTNHVFGKLVKERDFSNSFGYKAWEDYVRITQEYQLGNYRNPEERTGSSSAEIEALMDENIEKAEVEITDQEKMILYRYPDEEGGEFSEQSSFLAEITFYFVNDQLVFSSVTPGYFSVEVQAAQSPETLMNLFTVEELAKLNPQIFTIAEVNVKGELLRQIMVPGQPVEGQEDVLLNAFYFFIREEEILHYAYVPFEKVSPDFPTSSILLYNNYFNQTNQ